jgi:hypothetical protein
VKKLPPQQSVPHRAGLFLLGYDDRPAGISRVDFFTKVKLEVRR